MSLPGFTADASVCEMVDVRWSSTPRSPRVAEGVVAQATIGAGGFGGAGSLGGIGDLGFSWSWPSRCEIGCALAAVACNLACAGTGPGYFSCLVACGAAEVACLSNC